MAQTLPSVTGVEKQTGATTIPFGWLSIFLLSLVILLYFALQTAGFVSHAMILKGWAKALHSNLFWLDCLTSNACTAAFQNGWVYYFPKWTLGFPVVGLVVYAMGAKPKTYITKDPGLAHWARESDDGLDEYRGHDPDRPSNKLHGYLGHLMSVNSEGQIEYKKTIPLYVRMEALAENVLVLGGVGAGKTRGYFRPLIMLGAMLGFTVIVFDLKYPQADSGFFDMIGLWKKCRRPVMMFTPFSPTTMRLPLMDNVQDYASALSTATTIMPPPEYGLETGKHYRDRDRGVLAAFLLAVAKSDAPNFGELLRMGQYTPTELKKWFAIQEEFDPESEVVQNLKGLFAQGTEDVASVLLGIKNALRVFYNPMVARATQSLPGENIDVAAAFRTPTLLYVGIQQEFMMEGDGVVLLQLTKRYIDRELQREAERQGGSLFRHVAYVLDEFPNFGLLPYMMRALGTMRSYNVSHHLGVQNLAQLRVVYGDNYAEALTTNVIGRKIFFPLAVDAGERKIFSETLGMTTVHEFSESDSRRKTFGSPLDEGTRQGVSIKKVQRPLLAPEEFPHFRKMEAVVMVRGSNPIRVFMPAIEDEFLKTKHMPSKIPNGLYELYKIENPQRENMAAYTQRLLLSGEFGVANEVGVSMDQARTRFETWVQAAVDAGVRMRFSGQERRLYVRLSDLPSELKDERAMAGHRSRDWTGSAQGDEMRITPVGWQLLTRDLRGEINKLATFGSVLFWLDRYPHLVEGREEREAIPEDVRAEAQAILQGKAVLLRHKVCRELFGVVPEELNKRIGKDNYIRIELTDATAFWDALQDARNEEEKSGNKKAKKGAAPKQGKPAAPWDRQKAQQDDEDDDESSSFPDEEPEEAEPLTQEPSADDLAERIKRGRLK